jgi:hypothetical protein
MTRKVIEQRRIQRRPLGESKRTQQGREEENLPDHRPFSHRAPRKSDRRLFD